MLSVPIERIVSLTDARDSFSRIVAEIVDLPDGMYILTKGGKPGIALINIHYLEALIAGRASSSTAKQPKELVKTHSGGLDSSSPILPAARPLAEPFQPKPPVNQPPVSPPPEVKPAINPTWTGQSAPIPAVPAPAKPISPWPIAPPRPPISAPPIAPSPAPEPPIAPPKSEPVVSQAPVVPLPANNPVPAPLAVPKPPTPVPPPNQPKPVAATIPPSIFPTPTKPTVTGTPSAATGPKPPEVNSQPPNFQPEVKTASPTVSPPTSSSIPPPIKPVAAVVTEVKPQPVAAANPPSSGIPFDEPPKTIPEPGEELPPIIGQIKASPTPPLGTPEPRAAVQDLDI